ncbi:cobyrinate a,c-diamide synthase [Desulfomonile tiedjei]|uniref:Cobyrinate a,c-diamide synthase n=1 Tax=Desulfomonile tiedjei (strain ATCC 49306 / DSM 6799 / DCB-1) TaxID=706587 RepID=I4CF33_DESTA|nr:cobyrinate a,c-diamide synthase [Desulfomonile tiedjei]AFM28174.1 hydrogenobyrinic acid a,c-diamide synthase (glutamine-hydrolysing), cobyrinate a,c-diamide synthase [Desulfomonile tiedjei DSM 6799]
MSLLCPRLVIAGSNSGVGKTSVTLALVSALRKRGLRVQTFKVGPDYLDPTYLSLASGRPCYNLDSWMAGKEYSQRLFREKSAGADIAVVEGVMGLFDGSDPVAEDGSTAEIARLLDAPVLLVVNAHGMARSIAALVHGFCRFDSGIKVKGVLANRCGSERHGKWLAESLNSADLPSLLAAIPRGAFPELPSRHLGLVSANSRNLAQETLSRLGDALEQYGCLDEVLKHAGVTMPLPPIVSEQEADPNSSQSESLRLGVALDDAFHFYYPDNLEALRSAGFELVYFSPMGDTRIPQHLNALYIGGGYPEVHAAELSANTRMLDSVREFCRTGRPVYAECGGLMYLAQGIEAQNGTKHPMTGVFPVWSRMLPHRKSLGYVEVTLREDSLFGAAGDRIRGHEFHYSELEEDTLSEVGWNRTYSVMYRRNERAVLEGFQSGAVLATYVHAHFASKPGAVQRFRSIALKGSVL